MVKRNINYVPVSKQFQRMLADRYTPNGKFNSTRLANDLQSVRKVAKKLNFGKSTGKSAGGRVKSSVTATPISTARAARSTRKVGASNSRSAGFFRTRRKSRKPTGFIAAQGVTGTYETGGILTGNDCVILGHATCPTNLVMGMVWRAILKKLLQKMGIRMYKVNDTCVASTLPTGNIPGINVGDVFCFQYYQDDNINALVETNYTIVLASTYDDIVATWLGLINTNSQNLTPVALRYFPLNSKFAPVLLSLEFGNIKLSIKSSLKIQNRSINTTGEDQADNVDNVPIYGKIVGGFGTGTQMLFPNLSSVPGQMVASGITGVISKTVIDNDLREPLSSFFYPKSKTEGKVHLDPGVIKTSLLTHSSGISLKSCFKKMCGTVTNQQSINPIGKYRFFAMEKMLDTFRVGDALPTAPILVAYEHNYNISVQFNPRHVWTTQPVYAKI